MKSLAMLALCAGVLVPAHAATKMFSQCYTEAGSRTGKDRSAFLKACTKQDVAIHYLQTDATGDEVLQSKDLWSGYDFAAFAKAAISTKVVKSEFESNDEFLERRKQLIAKPVYAGIGLDSRIAIVISNIPKDNSSRALGLENGGQIGYRFDPEAKTLDICPTGAGFTSSQLGYAVESVVVANTDRREYSAQNAYGAKVNVTEISGTHVTVAVPKGTYPQHCISQTGIDGSHAQEQLKSIGVVLFGHLKQPYFETSSIYSEATITSPIKIAILVTRLLFVPEEIVVLDRASRQVLQRAPW